MSLKKTALNITSSCGPLIYTVFFLMKFIIYSRIATFSSSQGIGGESPAALLNPCKLIMKFFDKTNDSKCALNHTLNYSFFFSL